MSGSQLIPTNTFATQSGNIALSLLDTNFSQVASFLNNPNNYTNYLVDSGGANAYVVTFPTGVIPSSYTAGLTVVMKVANANTGASTLNVNSLGTKNILNPDASSLSSGQLASGSLVMVVYDGTQFILLGGSATTTSTQSYNGFKNRIINGAMVINQRGSSSYTINTSASNTFSIDRFAGYGQTSDGVYTLAQSSTAPTGFNNSLLATVTTADASIGATQLYMMRQFIEGYNVADLGWGAAGASTVTLSFWVRSSLTGTFGGTLTNDAQTRFYPFSYTISSANTWEQKSITIAGDTSGTWEKTTARGIDLVFSFGAGSTVLGTAGSWGGTAYWGVTGQTNLIATNGATFYITGVQLEKGSTATSFDYRPYGTELALCQRYYETSTTGTPTDFSGGFASPPYNNNTQAIGSCRWQVSKRAAPTVTLYDGTGTSGTVSQVGIGNAIAATAAGITIAGFTYINRTSGSFTANAQCPVSAGYIASSEL